MQTYYYKAMTDTGKKTHGVATAENAEELKKDLKKQGIYLLDFSVTPPNKKIFKSTLSSKDMNVFTTQLAAMLKSAITISMAMAAIRDRTKGRLHELLMLVCNSLKNGLPLSEALHNARGFPSLLINIVKIGEDTGTLDKQIKMLAEHYSMQMQTHRKIKYATAYPKTVVFVFFVVEILKTLVLQAIKKEELSIVNSYVFYELLVIAIIVITLSIIFRLNAMDMRLSKLKLRTPYFGRILSQSFSADFASALATSYDAGIRISDAVYYAAGAVDNAYMCEKLKQASDRILSGMPLSVCLRGVHELNVQVINAITIGERSGSVPTELYNAAHQLADQAERGISAFIAKLGPLLVALMGVALLISTIPTIMSIT